MYGALQVVFDKHALTVGAILKEHDLNTSTSRVKIVKKSEVVNSTKIPRNLQYSTHYS